ncbi:MAG TPA: thermonuclease family protein [Gammaproteobacteria bacterium]|nr:thermonuclease family protein [Gammaproteobacteria bacterium]
MPHTLHFRVCSRTAARFFTLFRAPCLFLALLLCVLSTPLQAAARCSSPHYDEQVTIKRVIDGDTLQLTDNRRLRLIGVNAPERGRNGQAAEPLAGHAWHMLQTLASPGSHLRLRWGKQKKDRYGRLLAHVFNTDGRNLSASLLRAGMGAAIQIPPNLWAYQCYLRAEKSARKQQRGIWGQPYFSPLDANQLATGVHGFHFIRGRLSRIGKSKTALWLNLGKHFALRIRKKELPYFKNIHFERLIGRELTARGWIYAYRGRWHMNLHHPASLEINPVH